MHRVKYLVLFVIILSSCSAPEHKAQQPSNVLQSLDYRRVTFRVPLSWKKLDIHDSLRGGITNGNDTLLFTFSTDTINDVGKKPEGTLYAPDTLDGFSGVAELSKDSSEHYFRLQIKDVAPNANFVLEVNQLHNLDDVLTAIEWIRFPGGNDYYRLHKLTRQSFH
ncbi:MAG: hypothetical protein JSS82_16585 [Bacteroidetes bacterium]|nr:hypothetical protein [Bacteroidota bacterium]